VGSFFLLLLLGAIWLGLNVIRVRTYDYAADYQRHLGDGRQSIYWYVVKLQGSIIWAAALEIAVCLGLAVTLIIKRCRIGFKVRFGSTRIPASSPWRGLRPGLGQCRNTACNSTHQLIQKFVFLHFRIINVNSHNATSIDQLIY